MEKEIAQKIKLLDCPFCKSKPFPIGFNESRERYGTSTDQCTIHCPGCGMDMKEFRKGDEPEHETYLRLTSKWNMRDKTLGVDINDLIDKLDQQTVIAMCLIGQQKELIGLTASYSDPSLDDSKYGFKYRHLFLIDQIKQLQSTKRFYKNTSTFLLTILIVILCILRLTIFK